ncbi:MAG: fatty acid--CoA ligase [Deltaproteobacteria bacterium]|nr:fatty acid--CoA ligase [Deltaproteobacteria bacterium]
MSYKTIEPTPSADSYQLLIKNLLGPAQIYAPEREIVYRGDVRYTYTDLKRRVGRLANMLTTLGVAPGDTVGVMDWDSHRYLECYFAVPMMGAVLHTINVRLSPEQMIYTVLHAEDDIILVNAEFLPLLEAVDDKLKAVKKIIVMTDQDPVPESAITIHGEYESLMSKSSDEYAFPDFDENVIATIFYTTGTTGPPKGVFFSHRQIVLHTLGMLSTLCAADPKFTLTSRDVYMPMTPMFHVHAWGIPYLMTYMGIKQVYPGRYEADRLLQLVESERVTFSHCVPTILHMLLNSPIIDDVELAGWKIIIGGSAMSKGLCQAALDRGINAISGYGMSETCPVLTIASLKSGKDYRDDKDQVEKRCRTGLPVPMVDLEIFDIEGNPLPHDGLSVGEVVVRSPWLTQGYYKEPEKSEALWEYGWLHTGDIGYIDKEGYLQITDRLKDVIKTGGEWVSSLELEDILSQHKAVLEAAIIGEPDEKWGERPVALVVLKPEYRDDVSEDDIREHFLTYVKAGKLPGYAVPKKILLVETIAKTSVGKINKRALRQDLP